MTRRRPGRSPVTSSSMNARWPRCPSAATTMHDIAWESRSSGVSASWPPGRRSRIAAPGREHSDSCYSAAWGTSGVSAGPGIHPRDMAALLPTVLRKGVQAVLTAQAPGPLKSGQSQRRRIAGLKHRRRTLGPWTCDGCGWGASSCTWLPLTPRPFSRSNPWMRPRSVSRGGEWSTEPEVRIRHYADLYGNPCTRVMLPAGRSTLRFGASALVPDAAEDADEHVPELPPEELPDEVLIYTLPSRYCLPDMLGDEAWSLFGAMRAGYSRVQ